MTDKTTLGDRMKGYEATGQQTLLRRTPVIIRLDGRAFHTYVRRFTPEVDPSLEKSPFSQLLHSFMVMTTRTLFREVQNCVLAYKQSDEISLLLRDWDHHETQQWFGGNVSKIVSITSAIASASFNWYVTRYAPAGLEPTWFKELALFDSRVFNLPKEEVCNYFIWRQQDWTRNSVQMLGRFYFSQKQMHGKNNSEIQDMLMLQKGVNWNDLETWMKRGVCVYKDPDWNMFSSAPPEYYDNEIPIFTQDRNYIERHLQSEEKQQ